MLHTYCDEYIQTYIKFNTHKHIHIVGFDVASGSKHYIVNILQVLFAGSLLKNNSKLHEALITAMANKASVTECIEAIEKAA